MKSDPSPFLELTSRMSRPCDAAFSALMSGEKAVVRLLGPRRTGKTDLVSWHSRTTKCPIVVVTIKPLTADVPAPGAIVADLLRREIGTLRQSAPKLHAAYERVATRMGEKKRDSTVAAELTAIPGVKVRGEYKAGTNRRSDATGDADVEIAYTLRHLEMAAESLRVRPIVFFDEVQELVLHAVDAGRATVWALRNEAQHHTACRYVFAGSNQRLFAKLQEGRDAPLLNFGTALRIPSLTTEEIDQWAVPLFTRGGRHVRSLSAATELLCGKIGEVVDVCNALWASTRPGDVIDEATQRGAVIGAASVQSAETRVQTLTAAQATVLRWVLNNPGAAPYGAAGPRKTVNPGAIKDALNRLMDLELIEFFGDGRFSCATPLRVLAAIEPAAWAKADFPGA